MIIKIQNHHIFAISAIVCVLGLMFIYSHDGWVEESQIHEIVTMVDYDAWPPTQYAPWQDKLTGEIFYKNKSTGMFFESNGNVGIGTSSPDNLIRIK